MKFFKKIRSISNLATTTTATTTAALNAKIIEVEN